MPTKKVKTEVKEKNKKTVKAEKYFYAVGRRKTAVARVRLFKRKKTGFSLVVNEKEGEKYFPIKRILEVVEFPLGLAGSENGFEIQAKVSGGGVSAQAQAVRLGIARALVLFDESLKKPLKSEGCLTRDSRKVERKKPGLKKSRKSPQWSKR